MFPAIHEHLSVQEWSELNKQAIGKGASGPRPRLILAGVVLEDATPPEGAWFMNVMPFPEAHAVARDRRPLVRQVLAVHPPGHQVADVVFQNCAADHGDTISVLLR
jgi:hypothetical protein